MTESEWLASTDPAAMLGFLTTRPMQSAGTDRRRISDRKLRLFACACCRQVWHRLTDDRSRKAVEVAERYADGEAAGEELAACRGGWLCAWLANESGRDAANHATHGMAHSPRGQLPLGCGIQAALLRDVAGNPFRLHQWCPTCPPGDPAHCPHRQRLLTPTVLRLARGAYEERSPARECGRCEGSGKIKVDLRPKGGPESGPEKVYVCRPPYETEFDCPDCHDPRTGRSTGKIDGGALDPAILGVLADALEEAGCDSEEILTHLRSPGPHVRGCWAVDLILNRE